MNPEIKNENGKIIISETVLSDIAGVAATENYGIVGINTKKSGTTLVELFQPDNVRRGVKVTMTGAETVVVDLYVTLEYGVSLKAVAENTIEHVRYRLETLTGLTVEDVNIHVEGIRI